MRVLKIGNKKVNTNDYDTHRNNDLSTLQR